MIINCIPKGKTSAINHRVASQWAARTSTTSLIIETCSNNPLQLQLDLAVLHLPQPQRHVLDHPPVRQVDRALLNQAVLSARHHPPHDCPIWKGTFFIYLHHIHERLDVELCVAHRIVWAERVLIKHFLKSSINARKWINK